MPLLLPTMISTTLTSDLLLGLVNPAQTSGVSLIFGCMLIFPLLAVVLWGIVLIIRGVRGRTLDDHPLCRRCGFDLFGLPAGVKECSECGADVSDPLAVRIGHRQKRPRLILAGSLLLLPFVLVSIFALIGTASEIQWIQYEPFWYLRRQVDSSAVAQSGPAIAEISRRIGAGLLSDAQLATLVDQGLQIQADPGKTWSTQWGDWIEAARAAGKLSDERWRQYLSNAPAVKLVVRTEVRRGDNLPIRYEELPARVGARSSFWVRSSYVTLPGSLAVAKNQNGSMGSGLSASGSGASSTLIQLDQKRVAATADGPQVLRVQMKLEIFETYASQNQAPVTTREIDLQAPWALVPADAPTVKAIEDESLRPAVQAAMAVESIEVRAFSGMKSPRAEIQVNLKSPPVGLAYKIILRSDTREWPIGSIYIPAGRSTTWGTGGEVKSFDADTVDVLFRPDPRSALDSVDLHEYWNREVTIKDVKVKRVPPPASAPSPGSP